MELLIELSESELDAVAGGQSKATLEVTKLTASGPAMATATATGVTVTAASVGGLTPSETATVAGTFTATSA
jgi:hypothetical protein